jgi:hypothetical protein
MSEQEIDKLIDPILVTRWLVERGFIWQMKLMELKRFSDHVKDRGLDIDAFGEDVRHFWQAGLIRADLVVSRQELNIEGLVLIKQDEDGDYLYADSRECINRPEGLGGVIKDLPDIPADTHLMFHPLRLLTVNRIDRLLDLTIRRKQILLYPEGYKNLINNFIETFQKRTSGAEFISRVRQWNEIASLVVAAEPFTFSRIFGVYNIPYQYHEENRQEEFHSIVQQQFSEYKETAESIGLEKIREVISDLCIDAQRLEPNKEIHRLIRLTERRYRLERVKGSLGGAVYLLTAAEMLRRSAEMVFETELPEEDQLGFGFGMEGVKRSRYGTHRLLESFDAKTRFIRDLGLDYTVRLRWYVEGNTELGAIQSVLGNEREIDIINLKGSVVAKQGKGLSFRENLLNDMQRSVYSWVSLDEDAEDNKRALIKAIEDKEMFGRFFLADPDFEFGNFALNELVEILWKIAVENGAQEDERQSLVEKTIGASNGKELFRLAKQAVPALLTVNKGREWGERLMEFAGHNPTILAYDGNRKTRPILEAIRSALHALQCDYYLSYKGCYVDKDTGRIVNNERV